MGCPNFSIPKKNEKRPGAFFFENSCVPFFESETAEWVKNAIA
jgi:hypothetical protein